MDLLCVVYRRLLMFHISCFVYGLTSSHFTLSEEYADSDNYIWHIPNGGKTPTIISEVPDVSPCTSQRHVLEDIGQEILRKLGLKAPPKVPNNSRNISHIKPLMALISAYEGYQRDSSPELEEDPSFQPETIILLANSSFPDELEFRQTEDTTFFTVPHTIRADSVGKVFLWVYIEPGLSHEVVNEELLLRTYSLHRKHGQLGMPEKKLVDERTVLLAEEGQWLTIPFRKPFAVWVEDFLTNEGVMIEAKDKTGHNCVIIQAATSSPDIDKEPYLEVRIEEKGRGRRHTDPEKCNGCCRHPFWVSFTALGWNFIHSPQGYNSFYCRGPCGVKAVAHSFSENITIPQPLPLTPDVPCNKSTTTSSPRQTGWTNRPRTSINRQEEVATCGTIKARSCCVPTRESDIDIVYRKRNNEFIAGRLRNMVVEECGCGKSHKFVEEPESPDEL